MIAIVAGLSRREVFRRFDSIVNFAALEAFIDNPVRTYSTGMIMRLAFSVAVHTDPDILLVDEFLSVGDLSFQAKCLHRISEMKERGCAIVLVSHDVGQVERLCDRTLWLKQGQMMAYGEPKVVVGQYTSDMQTQTLQRTPRRPPKLTHSGQELKVNENRFGSLEVEITHVQFYPTENISGGDALKVEVEYFAAQPIEKPIFCISISRESGEVYLDTNTVDARTPISTIQGQGCIHFYCDRLDLKGGQYFVDIGIFEKDWEYAYDYHWHVYPFWVHAPTSGKGILVPPMRWSVSPRTLKVEDAIQDSSSLP